MKNEEFAKLFKNKKTDEVIVWKEEKLIGFSVLRDYPEDGNFIPSQSQNEKEIKNDVVLIRVGYYLRDDNEAREGVDLIIRVSKFNRYLSGRFDYNFNDPNSPTKRSLKISKASKQPIDLENITTFSFNPSTKEFINKKNGKTIDLNKIIDELYNSHINTTNFFQGSYLRAKMNFREKLMDSIALIIEALTKLNFCLFGKRIKEDKEDLSFGIFKPYPHKQLITVYPEKLNLLGTNFSLSRNTIVSFPVILFIIFLISYLLNIESGFIDFLIKDNSNNLIYIFSFMIVSISILDYLIPHFILIQINLLIKLRLRLMTKKPKVK